MNRAPLLRAALSGTALLLALTTPPARAETSITPRFGYYFDNTSQRQSAIDYSTLADAGEAAAEASFVRQFGGSFAIGDFETARNSSQLAFPQYGGTLTFTLPAHETTQVALTALYGRTSGTGQELIQRFRAYSVFDLLIRDTELYSVRTNADYTRLDLEGTLQHRLNETFSLIAGMRAERFTIDGTDAFAAVQSYHLYNAVIAQLGLPLDPYYQTAEPRHLETYRAASWTYSGRIGAAAFASAGDRHLFYVNGLLQLSYRRANDVHFTNAAGQSGSSKGLEFNSAAYRSESSLGPDISVGYLYRLNDRLAIDVRYRATVYFTVNGPSDFKDSRVNHGLGVGFTTWLGR